MKTTSEKLLESIRSKEVTRFSAGRFIQFYFHSDWEEFEAWAERYGVQRELVEVDATSDSGELDIYFGDVAK
jgi:hypothetical protein